MAVIDLAASADAIVADDRYLNQHRHISGSFGQKPIYTSYDLFTSSNFSVAEQSELVTSLRRAGFCFVPMSGAEVNGILDVALIREGQVVETAELKALRESLLVARMSNSLQIPKEGPWLDNLLREFLEAIRLQWRDNADVAQARARSNWLAELLDARGWAQRTNPKPHITVSDVRFRAGVLSLSLGQGIPRSIKASYWEWIEDALLAPIKEDDAEMYQALVEQLRFLVTEAIGRGGDA